MTHPRPFSAGETKTAVFSGLSFWMTGRSCLPDQELKRLIVEHGGVMARWLDGWMAGGLMVPGCSRELAKSDAITTQKVMV